MGQNFRCSLWCAGKYKLYYEEVNVTVNETAFYLADSLANDTKFVKDIGLDEYPHEQAVLGLGWLFGFILAMHATARQIFVKHINLTLDEKFIRLIYSRFNLVPGLTEIEPDIQGYSENCYEQIKIDSEGQSQTKWDDLSLRTKFFEVCLRVFDEENHYDNPEIPYNVGPIGSRQVLSVAFKAVFSHVNWELDDMMHPIHVNQRESYIPKAAQKASKSHGFARKLLKWLRKIYGLDERRQGQTQILKDHRNTQTTLYPKKAVGPDSRLKKYPLLYLYFDNFDEITMAYKEGAIYSLQLADNYPLRRERIYKITGFFEHPADREMLSPMKKENLDKIMADENAFLELYEAGLLRLKLSNDEILRKDDGDYYWDRIIHSEGYAEKSQSTECSDPDLIAYTNALDAKRNSRLTAIKLRYGLTK